MFTPSERELLWMGLLSMPLPAYISSPSSVLALSQKKIQSLTTHFGITCVLFQSYRELLQRMTPVLGVSCP